MTAESGVCPACGAVQLVERFRSRRVRSHALDAVAARPDSRAFGASLGPIRECERCAHGWVTQPDQGEISHAYEGAEHEALEGEERGRIETARRSLELAAKHVAPGPLLDVGCWTGSLLGAARDLGWDPVGIEPSDWAAERARRRGFRVHTGTLEDAAIQDRFKLVVMCDVIEHIVRPDAALATVHGLLAPGGAVMLTLPDAGSKLARALGSRWWSILPMHVQYFNKRSMTSLLERSGFRVAELATHPKVFSAKYYAQRLGGYSTLLERAAVTFLRSTTLAERLVAPNFGDRMIAIAMRQPPVTS